MHRRQEERKIGLTIQKSLTSTDTNGDTRADVDSVEGSDGADENEVEHDDAADNNLDSNDLGGEEDDHDPAGIEIYDLAQNKTFTDLGPYTYGDVIDFTITVYNQGSIESSGITITDYIPCGYEYLTSNDANGWSFDMATNNAEYTFLSSVVPGQSVSVVISLAIQQCSNTESGSIYQ